MRNAFAAVAVALSIVVGAVVLSGCGGGSASPPPTKEAYLRQVNGICANGHRPHETVVIAATKKFEQEGKTPKAEEEVALELLGPYEETTEQLAELTPPKGGEQKVATLIKAREDAAEAIRENPLVVFQGHPYRKVEALARNYGLLTCLV